MRCTTGISATAKLLITLAAVTIVLGLFLWSSTNVGLGGVAVLSLMVGLVVGRWSIVLVLLLLAVVIGLGNAFASGPGESTGLEVATILIAYALALVIIPLAVGVGINRFASKQDERGVQRPLTR